jgi:hypothetical protein
MKVMIIESVEGYCREFYFRVKCVIYARMQHSYEESGEDIVDIEMKAKFTAQSVQLLNQKSISIKFPYKINERIIICSLNPQNNVK